MIFAEGEVKIGENLLRLSLGEYSPMFTEPEANNKLWF